MFNLFDYRCKGHIDDFLLRAVLNHSTGLTQLDSYVPFSWSRQYILNTVTHKDYRCKVSNMKQGFIFDWDADNVYFFGDLHVYYKVGAFTSNAYPALKIRGVNGTDVTLFGREITAAEPADYLRQYSGIFVNNFLYESVTGIGDVSMSIGLTMVGLLVKYK